MEGGPSKNKPAKQPPIQSNTQRSCCRPVWKKSASQNHIRPSAKKVETKSTPTAGIAHELTKIGLILGGGLVAFFAASHYL